MRLCLSLKLNSLRWDRLEAGSLRQGRRATILAWSGGKKDSVI
jgi:hypothetical protein